MIERQPIIITGIPRSGASMIAGVVLRCNAFGGSMSNFKGVNENDAIKETLEKPYLVSVWADEMGQYPLPEKRRIKIPLTWKESVEEIMEREGYKNGEWFYKSSKACLLWEIWNNAYPRAKWIIVRRRTGDIVESCKKTGYMKAFKDVDKQRAVGVVSEDEGWLWWVHEYEKRFVEMITAGLDCKVIYPGRLVYGDYSQLYEMLDWLRLKWNRKIFDYIDPLLETARKKEKEVKDGSFSDSR
jgi:hypothetical protein